MARRNEDLLDRFLNNFSLRGTLLHPGTLFVAGTAITIAVALNLWERYQHRLLPADQYELTAERIRITPTPAWAKIDLKRLLLDVPDGHQPLNVLDTDVVQNSVNRLRSVGWIEEIHEVRKSTDGLDVQLNYRVPVSVVELNHTNVPGWPETKTAQVMPVDRHGMIMPAQIVQHYSLPRISVFNPARLDSLRPWSIWLDQRIVDAANIMDFVGPQAEKLGVYRVMTRRSNAQPEAIQIPFELWPATGTQVVWGNAPGKEAPEEATAQVKLHALIKFVDQNGSLEHMPKRRIDLRSGEVVITEGASVAESVEMFKELK